MSESADITTVEGRAWIVRTYQDAATIAEGCARLRDRDASELGITPEALQSAIHSARELRFRAEIRRTVARMVLAGERPKLPTPDADAHAFDAAHYAACVVDTYYAAATAESAARDGERIAADPATEPTLRQQAAAAAQYARVQALDYRAQAHAFSHGETPA
ncbi:hypothetical protein ACPXCP_39870 [Streptomyces sp. DT20]|uniref:hypothetical protein n=1 Tax=Streptomyces sp. DT20 TaxID=3416519 RepID=UPI003CEAF0CC